MICDELSLLFTIIIILFIYLFTYFFGGAVFELQITWIQTV